MNILCKTAPKLSTLFLLSLLMLAFTSVLIFAYFWISHEYARFEYEAQALREEYVASQQRIVQEEVEKAIDYIHYNYDLTEERLRKTIQQRVYEAHAIATHLHDTYAGQQSDAIIQTMIKEALRPIRFNQGRGYYFAINMSGIEELFADHPELEGKNLLDWQDTNGQYVIRDMLAIARQGREGFYHYTWTKPNATGQHFEKIAFVKFFEPYNWVIGSGEYLDDVQADIQQEVLDRLIEIRFGKEGYIFGSTYTGAPLLTNGQITAGGKSLRDLTDPHGVKIFQAQREAVKRPEGGIVRYAWKKLTDTIPTPKISFVKGFAPWQWIIGAGVYLDEIDVVIAQKNAELIKRIKSHFVKVAGILAALVGIIGIAALYLSHKIRVSFDTFMTFFASAATKTTRITEGRLFFSEFMHLAYAANHMIDELKRSENERKQAEREFRTLNADLEQRVQQRTAALELANRELKDFAYVVSHDLKAPLRGISRLAYWLSEDYAEIIDEQGREMTHLLIGRVKRMDALIDGILQYSRIGRIVGEYEQIDIRALVVDVLEILTPPDTISISIQDDLPVIWGERIRISQIFQNLLENAIKFIAAPQGKIAVACKDEEPFWTFSITDNGPGIDAKYHHKIFQIFQTLRPRDEYESTGIGLALVKKIVEFYGGTIWVESHVGNGSAFFFTLHKHPNMPE